MSPFFTTIEQKTQFVAFVRVEIGSTWFIVSDFSKGTWRAHHKLVKVWVEDDDIDGIEGQSFIDVPDGPDKIEGHYEKHADSVSDNTNDDF